MYCAFTPKELIAATGAIQVSLCASSETAIPGAEAHLARNLCPLPKASYGFALTDTCPGLISMGFGGGKAPVTPVWGTPSGGIIAARGEGYPGGSSPL